ncbi:hypothetical protein [Streptomyces tubercidicus]|uniref:hypothetical protein n=1 Tax=Streptomyces tubercidicus TaxID=47759 RepID=UPI002E19E5F4|nr:hypothetical protein OG690_20390 [Streptomyces tubercidicus]
MSGGTFGRHHPDGAFGSGGLGGSGGSYSARTGTPYGQMREASGAPGAPGVGELAGVRGESADVVRGLYAAREAQGHPNGEPGSGHQTGATSGQGRKTGQVSGSGDDIAVTDGAQAATEGASGAGDEPDSHAYGNDGPTGPGFGGGTGNGGDGDGDGRSHPTGGDFGGEDDLRRLLHSRVGDLEPAPDALDRLRRAVPARRQRRRHAVVGAAAALLLGGTSIPAMVHVAHLAGSSEERPANAAGSARPQGGAEGAHGEGTEQAGPQPPGKDGEQRGEDKPAGKDKARDRNGAGHGVGSGAPAPDETMDVTSPACGRDQLGKGTSTVGTADSAGRVYGAFRVVNTSGTACSVEGGGSIGLVAQGSTNADRIHVVDHTSGDEATGLPDPATTPDQLVLKPGEAYEVKFAWIPDSGGGTTGCATPGPSPTPDPSKDPGQSPEAGTPPGDGGGQAGGDEGPGDGGSASGSIVLSHTPEAGEPAAADAKVADACAGTVYRTEALAGR